MVRGWRYEDLLMFLYVRDLYYITSAILFGDDCLKAKMNYEQSGQIQ